MALADVAANLDEKETDVVSYGLFTFDVVVLMLTDLPTPVK